MPAKTLTMMIHKGTDGDSPVSNRSGYAIVSACGEKLNINQLI
jgi:hypothetical protein